MLRNVVSNTYKDRKYPERFDRGQDVEDEKHEDNSDIDLLQVSRWSKQNRKKQEPGLTPAQLDALKGLSV